MPSPPAQRANIVSAMRSEEYHTGDGAAGAATSSVSKGRRFRLTGFRRAISTIRLAYAKASLVPLGSPEVARSDADFAEIIPTGEIVRHKRSDAAGKPGCTVRSRHHLRGRLP